MSPDAGLSPHGNATELQTLLRKLSDIGDEIALHRRQLERLTLEFHRVDADIRAASPSAEPVAYQPGPATVAEISIPNRILEVLTGAGSPMSAREIAQDILKLQGQDASPSHIKSMTHRVCVSLWVQNQKGLVRKIEHSPSRFRWSLVRV